MGSVKLTRAPSKAPKKSKASKAKASKPKAEKPAEAKADEKADK